MGKLYWPCGRISDVPLRLPMLDVSIYSIEELCYLIRERTQLVDRSLMSEELLTFIDEKLGLSVAPLRQLLHFNGTLATFCQELLELSVYPMSEAEWRSIREILVENETLSAFDREIRRADALLSHRHYFKAFHVYGAQIGAAESDRQRAYLYGQMAKAAFFLFHHDVAAEFFMRSYQCEKDDEMLLGYLLMKRFLLTREQYISFAEQHQEYYELTLRAQQLYDRAWERAEAQAGSAVILPPKGRLINEFREMME